MDATPATALGTVACLHLLHALQSRGLHRLVLCPGSRSGPLALAASLQESRGLTIRTAIDERSAAFFALGWARGSGQVVAVVTTSGSAVANLLPALVEADHGAIPLVLLTADRPARLKDCGANQTVNQEVFLRPCCRWFGQGAAEGLAAMNPGDVQQLAFQAMAAALGNTMAPPGPVHLNLPLEEPLHADEAALAWFATWLPPALEEPAQENTIDDNTPFPGWGEVGLDPDQPGVVVAGPWRGNPASWAGHLQALERWQQRTGWPVLADALSSLRGVARGPLVVGYDLLLGGEAGELNAPQVLRLGTLPASRRLQSWLERQKGAQVLVSESDPRPLDPLNRLQGQWSGGLARWPGLAMASVGSPSRGSLHLTQCWLRHEAELQKRLNAFWGRGSHTSSLDPQRGIEEPWLARRLSQLLPPGLAVMLANSSPVRDWETFADPSAPGRPIFSFRGASGIDGTLSIACGLTEAVGRLVLVSGDLALQHDSNGWLWRSQLKGRLLVVCIDNGGGGIFEQLPIRPTDPEAFDFERLFVMPQAVDPCALAAAHSVPSRTVLEIEQLAEALDWGLGQSLALLRVVSDRKTDATRRRQLRTMAAEMIPPP